MSHGGDDEIPEEHEEHVNHEAWVIPYADLLTLLMAMFIALFAISTVDTGKFQALARGFSNALGGGKLDSGIGGSGKATSPAVGAGNGNGPFSGGTLMDSQNLAQGKLASLLAQLASQGQEQQKERQTLADLQQQIENAANSLGLGGKVQTRQLNNGLQVTLLTDQVLFDSGSADINPRGFPLLDAVGRVLASIDNPILIRGYTDNVPIHTAAFPDNRHLGGARAISVEEYFIDNQHIDEGRIEASARGDQDPVGTNATPEGRAKNRRVEIIVQSKLVKQTLDQAGLNSNPAVPHAPAVSPPTGDATPNLSPGLGAN